MNKVWLAGLLAAVAASFTPSGPVLAGGGAKVTGGGQYVGDFGLTYVSVNAIQKSDGTVTGQFEQHNPDQAKIAVHGSVTCIDFLDDHTALIIGTLTVVHDRIDPTPGDPVPGDPFVLLVQDNGQGSGTDKVAPYGYDPSGGQFPCGDPGFDQAAGGFFLQHLATLTAGNFQISR